jgi:hypothetical protein
MADATNFDDCNAKRVFADVIATARSAELRSLWGRMLDEIERNGVDASAGFLETEFSRLGETFLRELDRVSSEGKTG